MAENKRERRRAYTMGRERRRREQVVVSGVHERVQRECGSEVYPPEVDGEVAGDTCRGESKSITGQCTVQGIPV